MRCSSSLSCGGAVLVLAAAAATAAAAAPVVLHFGGHLALLALLLLHEQVHQHDLLFVDLQADVFRDVWDDPVHDVAHQHDDVLRRSNICSEYQCALCLWINQQCVVFAAQRMFL